MLDFYFTKWQIVNRFLRQCKKIKVKFFFYGVRSKQIYDSKRVSVLRFNGIRRYLRKPPVSSPWWACPAASFLLQVSICLECNSSKLRGLKRKWIRCSAQATVLHLKKFIAKKLNLSSFNEVNRSYNESLLVCKSDTSEVLRVCLPFTVLFGHFQSEKKIWICFAYPQIVW